MEHFTNQTFVNRYPLSSLKIVKKMISSFPIIIFFFFWIGAALNRIFIFGPLNPITALFLIIIILTINYVYQKMYIKTYFYNMSDTLLVIRKGVFAPQEITVPFGRIQDVYVDQDIIDRLFDIYDVHISTATAASTSRAHIDGVDKKVAEELRTLILNKVQH